MTDVRYGLGGYGLFGAHHAAAIDAAPSAELAAIAVKSEASRAAAREAHPGVEIYGDYRELLDRDDIDIIDVTVPNVLHHEVAAAALDAARRARRRRCPDSRRSATAHRAPTPGSPPPPRAVPRPRCRG